MYECFYLFTKFGKTIGVCGTRRELNSLAMTFFTQAAGPVEYTDHISSEE